MRTTYLKITASLFLTLISTTGDLLGRFTSDVKSVSFNAFAAVLPSNCECHFHLLGHRYGASIISTSLWAPPQIASIPITFFRCPADYEEIPALFLRSKLILGL